MNLETTCGTVNPMSVQFVNETEDIVNGSTCWGSNHDSGDSDDGNESPAGMVHITEDSSSASRRPKPGKKTMGRVKIKMEYIKNKVRRYTTFSKRKTGIMKKAYELSALTGTQVMLLVASETGHVYTFATRKLQPMITSENGKALIQTCLNSPDLLPTSHSSTDQPVSQLSAETLSAVSSNGITNDGVTPCLESGVSSGAEKKELSVRQGSILAHSTAVVESNQSGELQSVLSSSFSKQALLPTSSIGAGASSCTASNALIPGRSTDCTDIAARPLKDEMRSLLQTGQHLYYQLPGTNQVISIPVEPLKENTSPPGSAAEQRPLAILNVGASNPTPSAGPAVVYPQGIVFASSANNVPTDGYFLSIPNTPALAISHDGLPQSGNVSGATQHFFTIPLSAQAQMFQPLLASTSAEDSSKVKLNQSRIKRDIT